MHERLPTGPIDAEWLPADPFGLVAVAAVALLCLLVAVVGGIALYAQTLGNWRTLFFMEQTFAFAVPAVKTLLAVAFVSSIGLVVRTS